MPWRDRTRAQPDSWFGITDAQLARELDVLPSLGIEMVRFELPWVLVARDMPGGSGYDAIAARASDWSGYDWERADRLIRACAERRLRPVVQVVFTPSWAGGGESNQPPSKSDFFTDFMQALVQRYGQSVECWEVWNEPNLRRYWDGTLEEYVNRLLRPTVLALRDFDPRPTVALGGLAGGDGLTKVLSVPSACFDVASFHYYPPKRFAAQRANVKGAVMKIRSELWNASVVDVPAWLTEVGAMTKRSDPADDMPVAGLNGQLRVLRQAVQSSGADAVFWYTLRDHAIWSGNQVVKHVYWGLFDRSLNPKPAALWLAERAQRR